MYSIDKSSEPLITNRLQVIGKVQGVGFRPLVYQLALRHGFTGYVRNTSGSVEILIQGTQKMIAEFISQLIQSVKSPLKIVSEQGECILYEPYDCFSILPSIETTEQELQIPADVAICPACVQELTNSENRRYGYGLLNCVLCGPRYTIINHMPYDRVNTSLRAFSLCDACQTDYINPADRRFHAQAISCKQCGPKVTLLDAQGQCVANGTLAAIINAAATIEAGEIVAIKGLGGYQLMCDACNTYAVELLRQRKGRPDKPFAVMYPDNINNPLEFIKPEYTIDSQARELLQSDVRPIVLLTPSDANRLSPAINPGLCEVGVMLPATALHYLLLQQLKKPIVATSANRSGEPIINTHEDLQHKLGKVYDVCIDHERPILRPVDDEVYRVSCGEFRPLRLGRGQAPLEISAPKKFRGNWLAVGGHIKNTIALGFSDRIIVSAHIGDLSAPKSMDLFSDTIQTLTSLYQVKLDGVVCDQHPDYGSSRWANKSKLARVRVQHHRAHASALWLETDQWDNSIMFVWDGYGLGNDGSLWGAEAFVGRPGHWQRVATFDPLYLVGADAASREIWRSLASVLLTLAPEHSALHSVDCLYQQAVKLKKQGTQVHSVGRLFDAAAALLLDMRQTSYEGQAPARLEALCTPSYENYIDLPVSKNSQGIYSVDWQPLFIALLAWKHSITDAAAFFHNSLAACIVNVTQKISLSCNTKNVGLTGGVFQNRVLTEKAVGHLQQASFNTSLAKVIPCNDAGLSVGQLVEVLYRGTRNEA